MATIDTLEPIHADVVLKAIRDRRSMGKVLETVPPRAVIEQILEAGTWAPNHHLSEPWRFFVLTGDGRLGLGAALADAVVEGQEPGEERQRKWDHQSLRPLRAPGVIAIAVEPGPEDQCIEIEEIASGAAAGQNMLLAAHALGLAAIWRSGRPTYSRQVREFLKLSERGVVLGFIYLGYPSMEPPKRERRPIHDVTTWLDH
ncbi:MAG: nitroreductase [Thermomicrobiales bacterium]